MSVPFGPRDFQLALLNDSSRSEMRGALLHGRNHPDDLDNYIWLYKNFAHFPFMQEAVEIWTRGDHYNEKLDSIAQYCHAMTAKSERNELDGSSVKCEIILINKELSKIEYSFTDVLSNISTK